MAEANGRGPKHGSPHGSSLLNGSSLAHLTGAVSSAKLVTEVRLPAARMAEVLEQIHRLGDTGSLQVNFHKGRALDLKWTGTRETKTDADGT